MPTAQSQTIFHYHLLGPLRPPPSVLFHLVLSVFELPSKHIFRFWELDSWLTDKICEGEFEMRNFLGFYFSTSDWYYFYLFQFLRLVTMLQHFGKVIIELFWKNWRKRTHLSPYGTSWLAAGQWSVAGRCPCLCISLDSHLGLAWGYFVMISFLIMGGTPNLLFST